MKEWALANPYLTALIVASSIHLPFSVITRIYRVIMVCARGWPTAPLMDADGDIVHPESNEA